MYLTKTGRRRLLDKQAALARGLRGLTQTDLGATKSGGGDDHFGASITGFEGDIHRLAVQIEGIALLLRDATDAPVPVNAKRVQIDTIVDMAVTKRGASSTEETYLMGGFDEGDFDAKPAVLAYNSPRGRLIMGCSVGDVVYGRGVTIEILRIAVSAAAVKATDQRALRLVANAA